MTFQVFFTVKNPPDPEDPDFELTLNRVAGQISLHLKNDLNQFLKFAMKLMGNDPLYNDQLMKLKQSKQKDLPEKCEEVLDLWARKVDSTWENVIAALGDPEVGLTKLAKNLTNELSESEQTRDSTPQGDCTTICTS